MSRSQLYYSKRFLLKLFCTELLYFPLVLRFIFIAITKKIFFLASPEILKDQIYLFISTCIEVLTGGIV